MTRTWLRRTSVGLGTLVTATALPLALATPAQAGTPECMKYLHDKGYNVGAKVQNACKASNAGQLQKCVDALQSIEVERNHAATACRKAYPTVDHVAE